MIKAITIKPFYYGADKEIYLDEKRFNELKEKGYVKEIKEEVVETATIKTNGKRKVLSKQSMETNSKDSMD